MKLVKFIKAVTDINNKIKTKIAIRGIKSFNELKFGQNIIKIDPVTNCEKYLNLFGIAYLSSKKPNNDKGKHI